MKKKDKQVHVRIPEDAYKKLKVKCIYEETSMQDYVAKLIAESLGEYSVEVQPAEESAPRKTKRRR
ncbi:MAG: hypothetical protein HYX92_02355 [Chloroflexi bacterium]|nr:hypothetical protein [Chloroflexota bacterium]